MTLPLQPGSLVFARRDTGVCAAGERGVCYELYQLDGRPGYGILFEHGGHDGFSPGDVDLILDVTGRVCPEVANYRFTNVLQLARDLEEGRFAAAFPPLKTYTGYRRPGAHGTTEETTVTVHQGGQPPRPLDPRHDLRRHSDAFNWGFGGSGPAQLALALAADVLGDDDQARDVYQRLKFRLVGRLPQDGWTLSEGQLRQAICDAQQRDQGPAL